MTDHRVGVYVHIPFCERVCPYCNFAVVAARPLEAEHERRYVDGLLRELEARQASFAGLRLASLYFGGGTPSLATAESIARVIEAVEAAFGSDGPVEITLEVNPSTLERSRLPAFREVGVNRVSVGVQSFDDRVLQRLGRAHRSAEAHRTLDDCRGAGFDGVSLDLIFAAPGQTEAMLSADLDAALDFGPDHVSTYELSVEEGTPFALAAQRGQLSLPDEAEGIAMLQQIEGRLTAAGFERYEISNYARFGHAGVHNQRYWQRRSVLGLGVGAVSTGPPGTDAPFGWRRENVREVAVYLQRVRDGHAPAAGPDEVFDAPTARGEAVFLALRTRLGLEAAGFEAEFGGPPRAFFADAIDRFVGDELLTEATSGDLSLTARGRLLADTVFAAFV